jgi:anti-sigma regulatory factor (Ser/Thr protein kinase)
MTSTASGGYTHDALYYQSEDELLAAAVPFLRSGLEQGQEVMVVCAEPTSALLSAALDADPRISSMTQEEVFRRAPGAIALYQQMLERNVAQGGSGMRLVGQVDFGASPAEWAEWARFDAVLNRALAPYPLWSLCMYDTRELPSEVLDWANLSHPNVVAGGSRQSNPDYLEPTEFMRRAVPSQPDPLTATAPVLEVTGLTDLRRLRQQLRAELSGPSLPPETLADFVVAVSEVATNALMHGQPPVDVRLWSTPNRSVCTVTDRGKGFDDLFAGYAAAREDLAGGGMGLWLARQLCDHLNTEHGPDGFTVSLAVRA